MSTAGVCKDGCSSCHRSTRFLGGMVPGQRTTSHHDTVCRPVGRSPIRPEVPSASYVYCVEVHRRAVRMDVVNARTRHEHVVHLSLFGAELIVRSTELQAQVLRSALATRVKVVGYPMGKVRMAPGSARG